MTDDNDIQKQMLEMVKLLAPEQLAELNETIRDALISSANGRPSQYSACRYRR